jgi:dienelactone hydrolase/DNA-directed RNA polymerase subunit RPC12/RpoP
MSIEFRCGQCNKHYAAADNVAGKALKCKQCGHVMRIPGEPPVAAAEPAPPAPARSIEFRCGQCGKHYAANDSMAGRAIKCKQCGGVLRVPGEPPAMMVASRTATAGAAAPPPDLDIYGLNEEPVAAASAPAGDEPASGPADEGPLSLPRVGAPPKPKSAAAKKKWEKSIKEKDRQRGSFATGGVFGVSLGGMAGVLWFIFRIWLRVNRVTHGLHDDPDRPEPDDADDDEPVATARADASPVPPVVASVGPAVLPAFPDVGPGVEVEPGVMFHQVALQPQPAAQGEQPGHSMKLWLYLPKGEHAPGSLPCVMITGAGSDLLTGMNLTDGDRKEHLPYARAGFAVLAYELDGYVDQSEQRNEAAKVQGTRRFLAARAGLVNAHIALEFLVAKVPQVDVGRIYAAGHSSAATLAMLFAANEPRVRGCVAYAPAIDLQERFPADFRRDRARAIPGAEALFTTYSPKQNESKINCPLFLFHALDDSNVPAKQSQDCAARLKALGKPVTLVTVPTGDHYNSMINEGIPRGIAWLKGLSGSGS